MLKDILAAQALADYCLHLRFEDGVEGDVDVSGLVSFDGIFAAFRDRAFFEQVRVNPELGAIYWPNGADLDPDVLYSRISGIPLPSFEAKPSRRPLLAILPMCAPRGGLFLICFSALSWPPSTTAVSPSPKAPPTRPCFPSSPF